MSKIKKDSTQYWQRKLWVLKSKAQKRGIFCELNWNEVKKLRSGNCYYCGIKNEYMTIDRKDNNKGYIKSNCVSCCWLCNKSKGFSGREKDMLLLGETIKKIREDNPNFWTYFPK